MKKGTLSALCFVSIFFHVGGYLSAQVKYPEKPIQALVGYGAGGATDSAARVMAEYLQKQLKQPVLVVNKPGGGGSIAGNELFKSKPDGYTVGMFTNTQTTPEYSLNPERFIYKTADLTGVSEWSGMAPGIFTRYDDPWKSIDDLVKYTKNNPNQLRWAHSGRGNIIWMIGTIFLQKDGIKMLDVPFQGDAESMTALLGKHVDMAVMTFGTLTYAQMEAKKIRLLAMTTQKRFELLPEVPTTKELGYDIGIPEMYLATFVPKGTPNEVITKLNEATEVACKDPEFQDRMRKIGMPTWYKNSKQLEELIASYVKFITQTSKQLGLN